MQNHLDENKEKGEIVDVQADIRQSLIRKRDIMLNFDKKANLKNAPARDPDHINPNEKMDEALSLEIWEAFG